MDIKKELIYNTVRKCLPSPIAVATAVRTRHDTAAKLHKLMVLEHARLVQLGISLKHIVADSEEKLEWAVVQLINNKLDMKVVDTFVGEQADANFVQQYQDMPNISTFLDIVNPAQLAVEAKKKDPVRIMELVDALLAVVEE